MYAAAAEPADWADFNAVSCVWTVTSYGPFIEMESPSVRPTMKLLATVPKVLVSMVATVCGTVTESLYDDRFWSAAAALAR
jgi:hypothetical protein